jgi:hypothetical protein
MNRGSMQRIMGVLFILVLVSSGQCVAGKILELGGGIAAPVGNLQDNWNTSFGANGALLIEMNPFLWGGFSASYSSLAFDKNSLQLVTPQSGTFVVSGGDASIISLCAEVRAQTGAMEKAVFYGGLGTGLYVVNISDITRGEPDDLKVIKMGSKNRWGGFANAGFGIPLSPSIRVGARAQYNVYWVHEAGGESSIVNAGDTSSYLTVQAMVMISLGS